MGDRTQAGASLVLGEREAHLWLIEFAEVFARFVPEQLHDYLSAEESARCDRFRFEEDRRAFLASHAGLRIVLSAYTAVAPGDWRFDVNRWGRPAVSGGQHPRLRFNLSHTRGLGVVGVTLDVDIGVDAEGLDQSSDFMSVAERSFAPAEIETLRRLPGADGRDHFLSLWTLKEAYAKAVGAGLQIPLGQTDFTCGPADEITVAFDPAREDDAGAWQFWQGSRALHRLALAVRRRPTAVMVRDASQLLSDALAP